MKDIAVQHLQKIMSTKTKSKYQGRLKVVRTPFTVFEIIVGNKAFVGVTGNTPKHAVRGMLFSYKYRYRIPNNGKLRKRLISFNELDKLGFDRFYENHVKELGSFSRSSDAQVIAIRRQNFLSHTYEMVSKCPGQTIGSRQLFSDEQLAKFETELNKTAAHQPIKTAIHIFKEQHSPLHGYRIEKEG